MPRPQRSLVRSRSYRRCLCCAPRRWTMALRSRILIVDDEIETRELLAELLRGRGFDVDIFDGGSRALEFLQAGPRPKVILLDLLLRSDMNGWQFLEIVKNHRELRKIPV